MSLCGHVILGLGLGLEADGESPAGSGIKRVKVDSVNFTSEIKELKEEASRQIDAPSDTLELIHQGRILDDSKTLKDYSVKPGDMVYVLKKYVEPVIEIKPSKYAARSYDIHAMVLCRGVRPGSLTSFINILEPVFNPSNRDKFLEIAPELENDPVAMSFLTAPELLFLMQDTETFSNINKDHPLLVPAFVKIYKSLLPSNGSNNLSLAVSTQHNMTESEEEYEDVELMDPEEYDDDSDTQGGERLITQEQLSAALAMARAASSNNSGTPNNSTSGPSGSSSSQIDTGLREFLGSLLSGGDSESPSNSGTPSRPLITPDMFNNALSQAISSVSNTSTSNNSNSGEPSGLMPTFTPSDSPTYVPTPSENNYTEQLTRMHEMGLVNHRINLRALIVSNGDVNSAINLVLSGAIDD